MKRHGSITSSTDGSCFFTCLVGQEAERAVVYSGDRRRRAGTGEVVRALVVDVVYEDPSHGARKEMRE